MENTAIQAIQSVLAAQKSFCKFLSANDTGLTGGHQAGIYISKPAVPILFDEPGIKGENKEKWANISWFDGSQTKSRFIYYGQGTRNEYRVTNFGEDSLILNLNTPEHYLYLLSRMKKSIQVSF